MPVQTYRFPQYHTGQIAKCIAERAPFETTGNLSGRPIDGEYSMAMHGWERHHPEWASRLAEIERDAYLVPLYVIKSFRTIVAVLVRDHHWDALDDNGHPVTRWEIDTATHSSYTSRAMDCFRVAIGQWERPWSGLDNMTTLYPDQVFERREIGESWVLATRLSSSQRKALGWGWPNMHPNTRRSLVRAGLIDERGCVTEIGMSVAKWCE